MWASSILVSLLACMREQFEGPYKTKNAPVVLAAYGGYFLVPILLVIRMAFSPAFGSKEKLS